MPSRLAQLRALVRVFFGRFFDNEIAGGGHDLKTQFFWLLAFLAAPGALVPFILGQGSSQVPADQMVSGALPEWAWGWAMIAKLKGPEALRALSLTDKTFYLGCAVAASALLTALVWNSLLPDRRDVLVLGPLPTRPSTVVIARLLALAGYLGITIVAMHAVASFSFGIQLAENSTLQFMLRGIAAHFIASCGASAFVFLAVVSTQGLLLSIAGPGAFARLAPALQIALIATAVGALLTIPTISGAARATITHTAEARPWLLWTPPLWFVGLYETVLGTDDVTLRHLATVAVAALGAVVMLTLATYPVVYARLVRSAVEQGLDVGKPRWAFVARLIAAGVSRSPRVRAVSEFFLTSIARVERQRFVLAASIGVALAWGLAQWVAFRPAQPDMPPVHLFATSLSTLVFLVFGLRIAAALPADVAPAWIFDVVPPTRSEARRATERTMAAVIVLPVAILSMLLVWWEAGFRLALLHAVFLSSIAFLVLQIALWRFSSAPCTRSWRPDGASLRRFWPAYIAGFFALTSGMAGVELLLSMIVRPPTHANVVRPPAWLVPVILGIITAIGVLVRRAAQNAPPDIVDEANLGILTEAFQSGIANRTPTEARSPYDGVALRRRPFTSSTQLLFEPPVEERDPWFADFSLRPSQLWSDARMAMRRLGHAPGFAMFSIVTLALGIGATTSLYSVARALTVRPMEIRDPDRVFTLGQLGTGWDTPLSWPDFQDLRSARSSFNAIEAETDAPAALSGRDLTTVVTSTLVTGSYFQLLGVDAMIGRPLQAADDRPDAPPAVVLAEATWRTRFGADATIIGSDIRIGGGSYTVVGVLPSSFRGVHLRRVEPALWVPMAHPPRTDPALTAYKSSARRDRPFLRVLARLAPGATEGAARAEVESLSRGLDSAFPLSAETPGRPGNGRRRWTLVPIDQDPGVLGRNTIQFVLVTLPALVLLIACTNLGNLVLSRGAARRREVAIRRALGASRWSLVREQIVEHGLLALAGGACGLALARVVTVYVTAFVQRTLGYGPTYEIHVRFDPAVMMMALGAMALAVGAAGLAPALQLTRLASARAISVDRTSAGPPRWRGRSRLIALQVAASVGLLLVAAVSVRAMMALDAEIGASRAHMDLDAVGAVLVVPSLRTHDEAEAQRLVSRVVNDARQSGRVQAVAAMSNLPGISGTTVPVALPGEPYSADGSHGASLLAGTSDMFRVLGLALRRGRGFDDTDGMAARPVAILSEEAAHELFGATDPVGRDIRVQQYVASRREDVTLSVVGVVSDAGVDRLGRPLRDVYIPFAQRRAADLRLPTPDITVIARAASGDAAAAAGALRAAVRRVDPDLAVRFAGPATSISEVAAAAVLPLVARIVGTLALVGLLIAMVGLYGVVSHVVAGRTRELGIRLALGAERATILRLVFTEGARPVIQGLVIGLVAAAIIRMAMQPYVHVTVSPLDLVALVAAVTPLVVAAVIACYVPAHRAARVDPNVALKQE